MPQSGSKRRIRSGITLTEAVELGISRSVDVMVAKNEYISAYWDYRTYKTELLPEVTFKGTAPYYSNSSSMYQKEDGSYDYVNNNYYKIDAGLSITQNIPWTGGTLSVESNLDRLRQGGEDPFTRYRSLPGVDHARAADFPGSTGSNGCKKSNR
ncbi:MAG: hypothetical protein ACLTZY_01820 [Alistipes indistinctus]